MKFRGLVRLAFCFAVLAICEVNRMQRLVAEPDYGPEGVKVFETKVYKSYFLDCGKDTYFMGSYDPFYRRRSDSKPPFLLVQIKEPSFYYAWKTLNKADALNGLEWDGWFAVHVTAARVRDENGWSKWWSPDGEFRRYESFVNLLSGYYLEVKATRQNGKWEIQGPDKYYTPIKYSCADIQAMDKAQP